MGSEFDTTWDYTTQLVHAGERLAHPPGRPTTTPLYSSSTYYHESLDAFNDALAGHGYAYGRNGNPTNVAYERACAIAEGGTDAISTASGMAAIYTALLAAGRVTGRPLRTIVAPRDVYGATTVMLRDFFAPNGVQILTCDMTDLDAFDALLAAHQVDVVYLEQLSNPLFRVVDMQAICTRAHVHGARTVVDNTIATPIVQKPLLLGADFVCHSATKYFAGHGDVSGGIVVVREAATAAALAHNNATLGMVLGPYEAQQILRGIKTMSLRVERQNANATQVAAWLAAHPGVARVHYPGLPSHPDHETAKRTLGGRYGAMFAFELSSSVVLERFVERLRMILMVSTLGDIYTMISIPALASHRGLTADERLARGITDQLIRVSIGIEAVDDIIADFAHALQ
jgi:cystathionine gamma-synthase/methionine-gamma-lyase